MCSQPGARKPLTATDTLVAAMAGLRPVDLSRRLESGMPTFPTHPKYFQMRWCQMGDPAEFNQLIMGEHTGTHFDAPSHFIPDLDDPARKHIDEIPLKQFMGRALRMTFGPFSSNSALVDSAQIRAWEAEHVPVEEGDIILCDFQWASRWALDKDAGDFLDGWPGLSRDAAAYLAGLKVKLVGTDCISLDPGNGGVDGDLAAHYTLLPKGILILENLCNLGEVDVVSYFMAFPLKIAQGTGSPVRAVAFACETT